MRVLSFTTVYPTEQDPSFGIFLRRRLQHVAAFAEVKLMCPRPWIQYSRIGSSSDPYSPAAPGWSWDDRIETLRPRWFYPPNGGALNSLFLFARTFGPALALRKRYRFQVIDAHFGHPEAVAAALLALAFRVPFIVTLRGSELDHSKLFWRRRFLAWSLRRAARIIAVAPNLRDLAIRLGVPPARVRVVPNGIDSAVFHLRDRSECRRRHSIPGPARLVLSVGGLISLKGHHRVMEAVAALNTRQGLDLHLWIVGGSDREPAFERSLLALPAKLGVQDRVRFLGRVEPDTVAELMSAADLLCLATSREGWPNVVNEALACGTPVVATNTGGIPDLIPSPSMGIVVPLADAAALQEALRRAIETSWDRAAIARWGQSRSWERVAEEALEELRAAAVT